MPRKKTPDYGMVLSGRIYDEDRDFVKELIKAGRKKKGDVLREAIHALRKSRQQTAGASR